MPLNEHSPDVELPEVSVVIPTYNGARRIDACLTAARDHWCARRFEVIVVDDGSTDDTVERVRRHRGVRLVEQANAGPGAARNRGVEAARAPIVVFLDDDCLLCSGCLDALAEAIERPGIVGAKGSYVTEQRSLVARFVQVEYEEKYARLRRQPTIDFIDTYAAAFDRAAFVEAGGFDAGFTTASTEDQELSFRLANAGKKLVFVEEAKVSHTHVATLGGYLRKKHKIGYWKVLVLLKNPNKIAGDSHTPATLRLQVGLVLLALPSCAVALALPWLPAAIAGTFFASSLPLTARCLVRDPLVALAAPGLILTRAVGLASGLIRGGAALPRFRRQLRTPNSGVEASR